MLLLVYADSTYFQIDLVQMDGFAGGPGTDSGDAQWLGRGEAPGCSLEEAGGCWVAVEWLREQVCAELGGMFCWLGFEFCG